MQQDDVSQKERDGWDSEQVADEASNKSHDEIQREMARGDETKGNADERDEAGSSPSIDTPQGREEAKNRIKGEN